MGAQDDHQFTFVVKTEMSLWWCCLHSLSGVLLGASMTAQFVCLLKDIFEDTENLHHESERKPHRANAVAFHGIQRRGTTEAPPIWKVSSEQDANLAL
jgi:hypothetical protein